MNFFLDITRYNTKNKANEELQQYACQWNHALVDEPTLINLTDGLKETIKIINTKYPRCQDIKLSTFFSPLDPNNRAISVDGNFHLSVKAVLRTETRDIKQSFSRE